MTEDENKRNLSLWEKAAIVIIVILVLVIAALIFKDHIEEYVNVFMDWYRNGN
ncbi:MAG: hypothetical protein K8S14_00405 [Actinomycetia bacterium]|nr:hypothetical protein [Actinomycetes bacterium]